MITVIKDCGADRIPEGDLPVPVERIVFLDLETTGLKPGVSMLYLAGVLYAAEGGWRLCQFFAEKRQEEQELLKALSAFLTERGRLILATYNGDVFDLPWLRTLEKEYFLQVLPEDAESLDLYRALRPYRKLAGLRDCRLPSAEELCGYCRTDETGGGELISLYEDYLRASEREEKKTIAFQGKEIRTEDVPGLLLCHNGDDLEGLPSLLSVLSYRAMFEGEFVPEVPAESPDPEESGRGSGGAPQEMKNPEFRYRLRFPLPAGFFFRTERVCFRVSEEEPDLLRIRVRLFTGELKHFYPDWKEYYYLPAEDTAVHRSLGSFVDRRNRVPASRTNCYTRTSGIFLPLTGKWQEELTAGLTLFSEQLQGEAWVLWEDAKAEDPRFLKAWGLAALSLLPVGTDPGLAQPCTEGTVRV